MTFLAHTFNFFFSATALFAPFLPFATRYKSMSEKKFLSYSSLTSLQSLTLRKTTQVSDNKERVTL